MHLGLPGNTYAAGRVCSMAYGAAVVALLIRAARRTPRDRSGEAAVWIAALAGANITGPFAPLAYVGFTTLLLVVLMRPALSGWLLGLAFVVCSAPFLLPVGASLTTMFLAYLPAHLLALSVPLFALWRAGRAVPPWL